MHERQTERGMRGASKTPLDCAYRFFVCDSALAAMDLVDLLDRPSLKALEAIFATRADVCFLLAMASPFLFGAQAFARKASGYGTASLPSIQYSEHQYVSKVK